MLNCSSQGGVARIWVRPSFISVLDGETNATLIKFSDNMKLKCIANTTVDKEIIQQDQKKFELLAGNKIIFSLGKHASYTSGE